MIPTHFWEPDLPKQERGSPLVGFSIDIGKGGEVAGDGRYCGDGELP